MIKLIDSYYDEEGKTSYAKILTDLGIFEGYAFLHPDDLECASSFLGCEVAEYRATIQYLEKKLYRLNIEIKLLEDLFYNDDKLYKIYNQKLQYKNEIKNDIKSLKEVIDNKVENRLLFIQKINEKKSKDSE